MSTFYSGSGVQPAQAVEFDDEQYRKNLQFLSAQWNSFHRQDELDSATDYRWKQWTLLYVMNF